MKIVTRNALALSRIGLMLGAAMIVPHWASAQTIDRLQSAGAINIAFVEGQAPFSSVTQGNQPGGYAIALCNTVARSLGKYLRVPTLTANYVPAADQEAGLALVEQGRADILCGPVEETLEARERVSFSIPIYFSGIGALVRRDSAESLLRSLDGQQPYSGPKWRGAVNQGLANFTYAVNVKADSEKFIRDRLAVRGVIKNIVPVQSDAEGIEMVAAGKADAFFADRAVLVTAVARRPDAQKLHVFERRFSIAPIAIALQRGDEEFRLAVDSALSELYRSGEYVRAYLPYFGEPSETARMLFQAYALR
jgi:polar amino acid transport system substrate-binding protein